jgi:Ca-activated chloride channel family protein
MTFSVIPMAPAELDRIRILPDAGLGTLRTDRGNLPLARLGVHATISGLTARSVVTTEFVNSHDTPIEATYVFPLPDRAAVTGLTMTADGRTVEAELQERAAARHTYDQAVAAGRRAAIAEEERPDVFTMRVGTILPGEHVVVELRMVGPLAYEDGAATFRFPLVVAPRYVPGTALPGPQAGDGTALDTDAVPDASRITPPVLLPGFPNPLRLSVGVDIDPAGLTLGEVRSSLHTVRGEGGHLEIGPGERVDRDFILRLDYAGASQAAVAVPDEAGDEPQGTYQLTVLPPDDPGLRPRPKDVVLLLDRSGSMSGWKMVAARRAAARVIDTLTTDDRFAVRTFDHAVDRPEELGDGLVEATDRQRFRAVQYLAGVDARGGTELLAPMHEALALLADGTRDRVLVLVTDGQVGNEDQILADVTRVLGSTRIHSIGIDRAVNGGFLARLASVGGGRSELVETEDRLDEAMEQIHRRIGSPVITDLQISADGLHLIEGTRSPHRLPSVYPGVPLVISGRYQGAPGGSLTVTGRTPDDQEFRATVAVQERAEPAVTAQWARAALRDLEDRYAAGEQELEPQIVTTSLRFGVLCRFTAFVAVDSRVVNEGGERRRVTQPVELPAGWQPVDGAAMPVHAMTAGSLTALSTSSSPAAAPQRAGFAPIQARSTAADPAGLSVAGTVSSAEPAHVPPQPPSRLRRERHTFAAVPSTVRAPSPSGSQTYSFDIQDLLKREAQRLADGEDGSPMQRRDLLADLASRLATLITHQSDPRLEPLRDLIALLNGPGDVAVKWPAARQALAEILRGQPGRKPFWKR